MEDNKKKSKKYKIKRSRVRTRKKSKPTKYNKFIKGPIKFSDLLKF